MIYKTALVTGASRGIGAAVVRSLRARDIQVHAVARPSEDLHRLADETGAIPHAIDVRDAAALTEVIRTALPDVLVSNAGVLPEVGAFADMTPAAIDQTVGVNISATLHATHAALGSMIEQKRGHIVLVGSIAGRLPSPGIAVYAATKAALHMFGDVLRLDLLGTGVRVTTVMPGRVETSIYDEALGGRDQATAAIFAGTDAVQPADVAAAICTALDMPPNVDVSAIEVMPTRQAYGGNQIARRDD
jgi:NADP-dependent 3-hydroxy acid dehydrogenase YdfG